MLSQVCVSALFLTLSKVRIFGFLPWGSTQQPCQRRPSRSARDERGSAVRRVGSVTSRREHSGFNCWSGPFDREVRERAFCLFPARTCRQAMPCGLWGLNYLRGGEWTWGCKCLALWASWELRICKHAPCASGPSASTHENEVYLDSCVNILLFTSYYGNWKWLSEYEGNYVIL